MWKASLGTSTRSWILQQFWGSIPLLRWEPVCCQHSAHWFLPSPPCCLCNAWADTHREVTTGEAGVVQMWLQTSCVSALPQNSKETLWKKEPFNVRFSSHSTLCFNLLDTASQYNLCMFRLLRLMLMWGVTFFQWEEGTDTMLQWGKKMSSKPPCHTDTGFLSPGANAKGTHCPQTFQSVPGKQKKTWRNHKRVCVLCWAGRSIPKTHTPSLPFEEPEIWWRWVSWLCPQTWW